MNYKITIVDQLARIPKFQWDALAKGAGPFLSYDFLCALEKSQCCNAESGWKPCHITVSNAHCHGDEDAILAAIPGYIKTHSYGEYIFDHGWANAYHEHGLDYYPKWISAIPFTPVTGPRILTKTSEHLSAELFSDIEEALREHSLSIYGESLSSLHWLFTNDNDNQLLSTRVNYAPRLSVQFQWHNYAYNHFDDFLANLTSRKRKDIKKTRRLHHDLGIHFSHKKGNEIDPSTLEFFTKCYKATYLKRSGHNGYLNDAFFKLLVDNLREKMLIITAHLSGKDIASALFFYDETGLYGRYWGALEDVDGLHFACCYFEGIAFAIEHKLPLFNPGTQGEHKILRGFEPVYCHSRHTLFEPRFHQAVSHFVQQESPHIANYFKQARNALPFKADVVPTLKVSHTTLPNDEIIKYNEKKHET